MSRSRPAGTPLLHAPVTAAGLESGESVHGQLSAGTDGVVRLVQAIEDAGAAADFQRHQREPAAL